MHSTQTSEIATSGSEEGPVLDGECQDDVNLMNKQIAVSKSRTSLLFYAGICLLFSLTAGAVAAAVLAARSHAVDVRLPDGASAEAPVEGSHLKTFSSISTSRRTVVSFQNKDGLTLRGWWFAAGSPLDKKPVIVTAPGYGGLIEILENFAIRFNDAGFNVLLYDNRNTGISDGELRGDIDPNEQVSDWKDAITFAMEQPGVDDGRVGVWGSSYAGGHVMVVAATDRRVKCAASMVPFANGLRTASRFLTAENLPRYLELTAEEAAAVVLGTPRPMIDVISLDQNPYEPVGMPTQSATDFFVGDGPKTFEAIKVKYPTWYEKFTFRSSLRQARYNPGASLPDVSPTPYLMIVGEKDDLAFPDIAEDAFQGAGEPKKFLSLDCDHFEAYDTTNPCFEQVASETIAWFLQHLEGFELA